MHKSYMPLWFQEQMHKSYMLPRTNALTIYGNKNRCTNHIYMVPRTDAQIIYGTKNRCTNH